MRKLYKNPFDENAELNNEDNMVNESSICNHHLVNACVYVQNDNERIGMVIGLLLEGYYMLNCHINQIYEVVGLNPMIIVEDGQIYPCGGPAKESKKFEPNLQGAIEHKEWLKLLRKSLKRHQSTNKDIKKYLDRPDEYQKEQVYLYEKRYGFKPSEDTKFKPSINCGTNVELFEHILLLRDDDHVCNKKDRKKLGIYDYKRLFIHNKFGGLSRFANMQDYNPTVDGKNDKPGYEDCFYRIATLDDVLNEFGGQGKIKL